jgi:WD40 repeat protein
VQLYRDLASAEPDTFRQAFASALDNLGGHLETAGRKVEAVETTKEALKLLEDTDSPDPTVEMAAARNNLAARLASAGQRDEAVAEMERAVDINRQLASRQPDVGNATLVVALQGMGDLYAGRGDSEKSEASISEAKALRATLDASKELPKHHSFIPINSGSRTRLVAAVEIGEIAEGSLAISADGSWFCVGSSDRFVHVFSAFTGKEFTGKHFPLFSRHHERIIATSMSSDGSHIVSLGDDNFAKLWDFVSMKYLQPLRLAEETPHRYGSIALSPNGRRIIAAGSDVQIAEDKSRKILETGVVRSLAIALDGSRILVARSDGIVTAWDGAQARFVRRYGRDDQPACRVATNPQFSHVVTGMTNGEIALFNPDGELVTQYQAHSCEVISLATNSTHVLSAAKDGSVCLWDLARNRHETNWQCNDALPSVDISQQGSRIVLTNGSVIELWHLAVQ